MPPCHRHFGQSSTQCTSVWLHCSSLWQTVQVKSKSWSLSLTQGRTVIPTATTRSTVPSQKGQGRGGGGGGGRHIRLNRCPTAGRCGRKIGWVGHPNHNHLGPTAGPWWNNHQKLIPPPLLPFCASTLKGRKTTVRRVNNLFPKPQLMCTPGSTSQHLSSAFMAKVPPVKHQRLKHAVAHCNLDGVFVVDGQLALLL